MDIQIQEREVKFRVGTNFPGIGMAGYPSHHETLEPALACAERIAEQGYQARVYMIVTEVTEYTLYVTYPGKPNV